MLRAFSLFDVNDYYMDPTTTAADKKMNVKRVVKVGSRLVAVIVLLETDCLGVGSDRRAEV